MALIRVNGGGSSASSKTEVYNMTFNNSADTAVINGTSYHYVVGTPIDLGDFATLNYTGGGSLNIVPKSDVGIYAYIENNGASKLASTGTYTFNASTVTALKMQGIKETLDI